jgi:hypothetical protein
MATPTTYPPYHTENHATTSSLSSSSYSYCGRTNPARWAGPAELFGCGCGCGCGGASGASNNCERKCANVEPYPNPQNEDEDDTDGPLALAFAVV